MAKYDVGTGLAGGLSGAATGSAFGPVGTVVGGVVGLASGLFGKKKKKKPKTTSTLDPQQQQLHQDYISSIRGEGPLSNLFNYDTQAANQNFDANVARPAYRNFQENIVPTITGQFRGNNLQNSSYAGDALAKQGRNVQENLDALRSNTIFQGQQQANQNKVSSINSVLGNQTFATNKPGPQNPSVIDQVLNSVAPKAAEWFSDYLSKPSQSSPGLEANSAIAAF